MAIPEQFKPALKTIRETLHNNAIDISHFYDDVKRAFANGGYSCHESAFVHVWSQLDEKPDLTIQIKDAWAYAVSDIIQDAIDRAF